MASGATNFVADIFRGHRHLPRVLSSSELLRLLRDLRDDGKTTNADLARLLGLPSSRIPEIFDGKRAIKVDEMKTLVEHFNLGAHPGSIPEMPDQPPTRSADGIDTVDIQNIDQAYGLGAAFTQGHVETEVLPFPKVWVDSITSTNPAFLTWTRGRGDSMAPTIHDGDLVLLDRSQREVKEQDALWAYTIGETGSIKRLRVKGDRYVIMSDNTLIPPDEEPIDFVNIVARVIFVGAKK